MDEDTILQIMDMITDNSRDPLSDLFHDFDYAIVGSPTSVYATYAVDVSREWATQIPLFQFQAGR